MGRIVPYPETENRGLIMRVWFESASAPRTLHNTNPPQIIIKGRMINLSGTKRNKI